jgi:hypothetical protein
MRASRASAPYRVSLRSAAPPFRQCYSAASGCRYLHPITNALPTIQGQSIAGPLQSKRRVQVIAEVAKNAGIGVGLVPGCAHGLAQRTNGTHQDFVSGRHPGFARAGPDPDFDEALRGGPLPSAAPSVGTAHSQRLAQHTASFVARPGWCSPRIWPATRSTCLTSGLSEPSFRELTMASVCAQRPLAARPISNQAAHLEPAHTPSACPP